MSSNSHVLDHSINLVKSSSVQRLIEVEVKDVKVLPLGTSCRYLLIVLFS